MTNHHYKFSRNHCPSLLPSLRAHGNFCAGRSWPSSGCGLWQSHWIHGQMAPQEGSCARRAHGAIEQTPRNLHSSPFFALVTWAFVSIAMLGDVMRQASALSKVRLPACNGVQADMNYTDVPQLSENSEESWGYEPHQKPEIQHGP